MYETVPREEVVWKKNFTSDYRICYSIKNFINGYYQLVMYQELDKIFG